MVCKGSRESLITKVIPSFSGYACRAVLDLWTCLNEAAVHNRVSSFSVKLIAISWSGQKFHSWTVLLLVGSKKTASRVSKGITRPRIMQMMHYNLGSMFSVLITWSNIG